VLWASSNKESRPSGGRFGARKVALDTRQRASGVVQAAFFVESVDDLGGKPVLDRPQRGKDSSTAGAEEGGRESLRRRCLES
jgi:hypothetical protein